MAKDHNGSAPDGAGEEAAVAARSRSRSLDVGELEDSKGSRDRGRRGKSKRREEEGEIESGSSSDDSRKRRKRRTDEKERRKRRRRSRSESSDSSSESESESSYSDASSESGRSEGDSEEERRRKRRRKRKEREEEERRRRRKEKERRKRKRKEKEKERERRKKKKKEKEKNLGKRSAVTNLWGKYGIIREIDMWNKRPEFTAWLLEVKQVNLESLANWEEKQMFKEFMEDHNTATFPSKKYYNLEAYQNRKIEKEMKKGSKNALVVERTVFNDEEQRRLELNKERERQKEEEVAALKRSMQTGMAQAMKEQARLREEMLYQYRLGNTETAAAIQRRLDPDAPLQ